MSKSITILIVLSLISGCAMAPSRMMLTDEYQDRPTLKTSLFSSDTEIVSEDVLHQILTSKVELPDNAKIALMKYSSSKELNSIRYYGSYYWRAEEYLKLQQEFIDSLSVRLAECSRVVEVILLPSLITPEKASISLLREAAARLQADMLFVFRVNSDIYQKYAIIGKDKAKAYSTCEAILLDVRTGLIPFTSIVTEDLITKKESQDLNFDETMARAEKEAALKSLNVIGDQAVEFLETIP